MEGRKEGIDKWIDRQTDLPTLPPNINPIFPPIHNSVRVELRITHPFTPGLTHLQVSMYNEFLVTVLHSRHYLKGKREALGRYFISRGDDASSIHSPLSRHEWKRATQDIGYCVGYVVLGVRGHNGN